MVINEAEVGSISKKSRGCCRGRYDRTSLIGGPFYGQPLNRVWRRAGHKRVWGLRIQTIEWGLVLKPWMRAFLQHPGNRLDIFLPFQFPIKCGVLKPRSTNFDLREKLVAPSLSVKSSYSTVLKHILVTPFPSLQSSFLLNRVL